MEADEAISRVRSRFQRTVTDTPGFRNASCLIHADSRDLHTNLAASRNGKPPVEAEQPFYAASIGKTFTATITAILVETGDLRFDDPISSYLSDDVLNELHVYRGTDYTDDLLVHHLLNHTSGLPHLLSDEFGVFPRRREESLGGKTFFDVVVENPDRFWEPAETIEWAKEHLRPHFPPGKGIYYSQVGYNLLGLLIETVTERPFHRALHDYIFEPLGMDHSYHSQFSEPAVHSDPSVQPVYVGERQFDVEQYRSFSGWYAGGQTVNTAEDLLAFHRALVNGQLVEAGTLDKMTQWRKLSIGFDYGYGVLRFRPLPWVSKYYSWGGLGSTNAFMLYNPGHDIYLIGTFNQTVARRKAMQFLFRTLRIVSKVPLTENR